MGRSCKAYGSYYPLLQLFHAEREPTSPLNSLAATQNWSDVSNAGAFGACACEVQVLLLVLVLVLSLVLLLVLVAKPLMHLLLKSKMGLMIARLE
jgi:hypothetical protein